MQQNITRGAFVIIFLICSNLLHCLGSVATIIIITESCSNNLKVILIKSILIIAAIFLCFNEFIVRLPQKFQVQAKISTIRPVFWFFRFLWLGSNLTHLAWINFDIQCSLFNRWFIFSFLLNDPTQDRNFWYSLRMHVIVA